MLGRWSDYLGNYVEYYKKNKGDSETQCTYKLPYTEGELYKLEDGVHSHGSDESGWTKQWSYTVLTADTVNAYCFKDGRTYTLYRINEE